MYAMIPNFSCVLSLLLAFFAAITTAPAADLKSDFVNPPPSARPWVYWFWLNGNITREGITADLEAMKRVGIGGVLIMEVDQGAPQGPVAFAGPQVARAVQAHAQRGRPAGPGSEHEQRRRLVRQRRAVDHARAVDAEGRLDGDQRRRRQALRGRRCRSRKDGANLLIATLPCWPSPRRPATAGIPTNIQAQARQVARSRRPAGGPGQVCGSARGPSRQGRPNRRSDRHSSRTAA